MGKEKTWERSDAVVAQRFSLSQLEGVLSKNIHVMDEEKAIIEADGRPVKTLDRGVHKVAGLFSGSDRTIVFVDVSKKSIRRELKELWTADDKDVIAALDMKVIISDPEKFRKSMMGKRGFVTIDDIWNELQKEVVSLVLAPIVKKKRIDKLQGDRKTIREMEVSLEVELKKELEVNGLDLLSFSVEFVLPDDYTGYLKRRGAIKEDAEKKAMESEIERDRAIREREVSEIAGTAESREKTLDKMERERIERETEMALEEEESQQDVMDALEAMKLKEVKDKGKMIKEAERKRLGLESLKGSSEEERERMQERYEELRKMIDRMDKKRPKAKKGK